MTNSAGLHYFKDPADDRVYLYTHLEPFFCHRFFPCFDQPSIKAPLKLSVVSPEGNRTWKVIANAKETDNSSNQKDLRDQHSEQAKRVFAEHKDLLNLYKRANEDEIKGYVWDFQACEPCSSYIYVMCAGEFS